MSARLKADLALTFCTLIWGATFLVVKDALDYSSVFVFLAARFVLAAIVMGLIYWSALRKLDRSTLWAGAQLGFFLFAGYALQTLGLQFTSASKAAFITGSGVVLVPVILAVIWRRHIHGWVWMGALAALVGVYLMTVPPGGHARLNSGDPLVLAGAVMFALHIIFVGRYSPRHSTAALSFAQVAATAALSAFSLPLLAATGWEPPRAVWSGYLIFAVAISAVGSTAIGFTLQVWAQQHTTPTHAAILISLEPVFAGLTSFLFAHERLGARSLSGAGLILAGILLAELKGPAPAAVESLGPTEVPQDPHP